MPWSRAFRAGRSSSGAVDGEFHSVAEARRQPHLAAAANWLALATLAARLIPDGARSLDRHRHDHDRPDPARPRAGGRAGRSDTERLQTGELVYAGVRRTPVCALATELPLRGIATGLAAEIFASTLDVYLTLGDIEANADDLSTADGRPATVAAARDRLARMVGADRDGFSPGGCARVCARRRGLPDRSPGTSRPSERRARRSAAPPRRLSPARASSSRGGWPRRLIEPGGPIISLKEAWGAVASSAGCAFALVKLAAERFRPDRRWGPRLANRPVRGGAPGVTQSSLTVIKVGGSLFDWPELAPRLTEFLGRSSKPSIATNESS